LLACQVAQNQRLNSLTAYAEPSRRPRKLARPLNAHESDYIDAIDSVADYLESIGADAVWVDRFDELLKISSKASSRHSEACNTQNLTVTKGLRPPGMLKHRAHLTDQS